VKGFATNVEAMLQQGSGNKKYGEKQVHGLEKGGIDLGREGRRGTASLRITFGGVLNPSRTHTSRTQRLA